MIVVTASRGRKRAWLDRHSGEISLGAHKSDQQQRRGEQYAADEHAGADDHQTGAGKDVVGFALVFLPRQTEM
ncbi:MAG: hypothetical protein ACLUFV_02600 [Acutalibacteraceae bacterium]